MRSIREGNFELYLASLYLMLPWFFALDRYNYARCATIYWFDMELLKHRCPNEYKEFAAGSYSRKIHEKKQKQHEDNPTFTKEFFKDTTTLLNNFPNNPCSYSMTLP